MSSDTTSSKLTVHGDVDRLGRQAVEGLLSAGICRSARYFARAESTNSSALSDLQQTSLDRPQLPQLPRLYLADQQTAGRGRHGRTWVSGDDTLTFSLILAEPSDRKRVVPLLPLAVGVGVARAIEFHFAPLRSRLKWPNDVYLDGGKVAGILIETTQTMADRVVIGVGINVNHAPDLSGSADAASARSIAQCVGRTLERYRLLESFVVEITKAVQDATDVEVLNEFRQRCLLCGRRVSFQVRGQHLEGECRGISDEGELLVQTGDTIHRCQSGETQLVRKRDR